MNDITNTADILDSRDIIARIEELRSDLEAIHDDRGGAPDFDEWLEEVAVTTTDAAQDDAIELIALEKLASQCEGYGDWQYGETLINDDYFETYAEELASDIGAIDRNAKWPLNHIDWTAAAEELKADYMSVDFDGETFWMCA